jgi:hypothetical protein
MFTTVAWAENKNLGGARAPIDAVPDQHVKTAGDLVYVPSFNYLMGGAAFIGTNAEEARFVSPSLRRVNPSYIVPISAQLEGQGNDDAAVRNNTAIQLTEDEGLEVEAIATPGAAERIAVIGFLSDGEVNPVKGKIITVHFTFNVALVASAWAFAEIVFDDELPVGAYDIVGAHFIVDNAYAGRFVLVGASHRPGCPTVDADSDTTLQTFRQGNLGVWGTFHTQTPPGMEIIANQAVAAADYDAYMDIIPR